MTAPACVSRESKLIIPLESSLKSEVEIIGVCIPDNEEQQVFYDQQVSVISKLICHPSGSTNPDLIHEIDFQITKEPP